MTTRVSVAFPPPRRSAFGGLGKSTWYHSRSQTTRSSVRSVSAIVNPRKPTESSSTPSPLPLPLPLAGEHSGTISDGREDDKDSTPAKSSGT
jgi:hypothetical protein